MLTVGSVARSRQVLTEIVLLTLRRRRCLESYEQRIEPRGLHGDLQHPRLTRAMSWNHRQQR